MGGFLLCQGADSNRRPHPLQGHALPTELPWLSISKGIIHYLEKIFQIYFPEVGILFVTDLILFISVCMPL